MLTQNRLEFNVSLESLKATILISLLTVWVLIGLFVYLNRYTKRRYFSIWTTAWLFYVLWLTLNFTLLSLPERPVLLMAKQWCLATVSVFLLWGSARFLGTKVRQMSLGLFLCFLYVWSYVGIYHLGHPLYTQVPLFTLIGLASLLTGWCFFGYRRQRGYIGARLLSLGFFAWGIYFAGIPFLQTSQDLLTVGFFISAAVQLFIAVSMIILVLEEVRSTNQHAIQKIRSNKVQREVLLSKIASTEQRYRSLFDQASEAIIITTKSDLRILELNETAERMLGISRTEANRQFLPFFCRVETKIPAENSSEWVDEICRQKRFNLVRKNGRTVPSEVDGAPIDYKGQAAYQFRFRELTDRTLLEQQLRQAEKLSALGQVISGVAHELNNPMAVIKGYLDLVLAYHELTPQTRTDLTKVTQECTRAIKLVRNFLAFAREQPAHREMLNVNELIKRVAEFHKFEIQIAQIKLALNLAADLPMTHADPDQIQQLIVNIVNNAIQAMSEISAARTLSISTQLKTSEIILIQIEDSGPGVPAELESRIFEPFFTTKSVGTGTGLGLSIAHSILTEHQGRIYYRRSSLGGAGFSLELPVILEGPKIAAQQTASQLPAPQQSQVGRVLVLDDEKAIAELVCEMLAVIGHQPVQCLNPAVALKLMETHEFDLIISDYRMPVMNGEEFYQKVSVMRPVLKDRIIFLTGDVVNQSTQSFLKSTGNPHLGKPFQLADLEAAVAKVLAKKG